MKNKFIALLVIGFMLMASSCVSQEQNSAADQMIVKEYIEDNISDISPSEPVLGGTWYVVEFEFLDNQTVKITYEDGHIQKIIIANYKVLSNKNVDLEIISETDV